MSQRHLSDDQLIDACLGVPGAGAQQHLLGCAACEARRTAVGHMLTEVSDVAVAESDAVFSPERLARQQARILQRIDQDGRPARVIVFPAGQGLAPTLLHTRPATRWVAAAAAAGLVLGVLGGHFARNLTGVDATKVIEVPGSAAVRTISMTTDDEFLGQIELAVGSAGPAVLRPIDALTPRAWEVR